MGVGDYVHSKEAGQPLASRDGASAQSRQLRAEQAKIDVPATNLVHPSANSLAAPLDFHEATGFQDPSQAPPEDAAQRDMFDTDVEAIDDSTVAGTSVFGGDDHQPHAPSNTKAAYNNPDPRATYQPRHARRPYGSSWYEGLGDKAMKKAGFESDDAEDAGSPPTSSVGGDDENTEEGNRWYYSHKHRATEVPLSKRLESFWSASKRAPKPMDPTHVDSMPTAPANTSFEPTPRKLGSMLAPTGTRKITLPHSMSGTPRTRFSPPKPSLLEQLDLSPTPRSSQRPRESARALSMTAFHPLEQGDSDNEDGMGEALGMSGRRNSGHSANAFDITDLTALDHDDETMTDPFRTRSSKRGRRETVIIHPRKRQLEADYPAEVLYQKSFADLQAEPFDKAPSPVPSPPTKPLPPIVSDGQSPNDPVSRLFGLTDQERGEFLARMSVDEWEECGDQLIDRFSQLLSEMKKLRRVRRQTAAVFEAEVKRRHNQVQEKDAELTGKLNEMRTGGAEVLRGGNL